VFGRHGTLSCTFDVECQEEVLATARVDSCKRVDTTSAMTRTFGDRWCIVVAIRTAEVTAHLVSVKWNVAEVDDKRAAQQRARSAFGASLLE